MIVIDLGCSEHYGESSIGPLIKRFKPSVLYGFDPTVGAEAPELLPEVWRGETRVLIERKAAWLYNGEVGFFFDGLRSRIGDFERRVPCFDFPRWLRGLAKDDLVVKFDIEGAEVPLLETMHDGGEDALPSLLLVEWHEHLPEWDDDCSRRRDHLLGVLRCPVEEWKND